jgi:hypothetical protein
MLYSFYRSHSATHETCQKVFEDEAANHIIQLHSVGANF